MGGVDTMCRTRGDRQARRHRGRHLTDGTGVGREGGLMPATETPSFATPSASWRWHGAQRCGRSVCPFVSIPAVMVLMTLTGR